MPHRHAKGTTGCAIVSRSVYDDISELSTSGSVVLQPHIRHAGDGPAFVHILHSLANPPEEGCSIGEARVEQEVRRHLQINIFAEMHVPRHFEKVQWFAIYWNSVAAEQLPSLLGSGTAPVIENAIRLRFDECCATGLTHHQSELLPARHERAGLIAAVIHARDAVSRPLGHIRRINHRRPGGPTCLPIRVRADASAVPTWQRRQRQCTGSVTRRAPSPRRLSQVQMASGVRAQ
jgi:hypothetical protein